MALLSYDERTEAEIYRQIFAEYESVFSAKLPLKAAFEKKVIDSRDYVALTDGARVFTYAQLHDMTVSLADVLRQQGIIQGMRVAIRMPNSLEFYFWYHAVQAVGAVAVLIPALLHAKEVTKIFAQCSPNLVISDASDCAELLQNCGLVGVAVLNPMVLPAPSLEKHTILDDSPGRSCDDPAVILYTGGSTGDPRGIVLSARNILTNAFQSYVRVLMVGLDREKFIGALPLAHSFGHMTGLWLPLVSGSAVFVMSSVSRVGLKTAFNTFSPTIFFGVPALFGALCMTRGICLNSVKMFVSGGDFLSVTIRDSFTMLFGRYICSGYGLSEASPVVGLNISPGASSLATISPLLAGISYKIISDVPGSNASGELWIKGDNVMKGYFLAEGENGLGVSSDGWLATGDMVSQKQNGSLVMVGRRKDIIVFKGFNIYPQEVENVLMLHPDVAQAVVAGSDHELFGQVPVAGVVLRQGAVSVDKNLAEHCKNALASYKIPHKIVIFNEFPLNHLGKIDRRTVKKSLVC